MTTYLLNALPNALIIPAEGQAMTILGISEDTMKNLLQDEFISAIGHENFAEMLSQRFGVTIPHNRVNVSPTKGDILLVAAVAPGTRLAEGVVYTEEQILALPLKFAKVQF